MTQTGQNQNIRGKTPSHFLCVHRKIHTEEPWWGGGGTEACALTTRRLTDHSSCYVTRNYYYLLLFSSLSDDRSKASSKTIPPHSAIQSLLLQMRASSPALKVIQQLLTSSSPSSCHIHLSLYLSFDNLSRNYILHILLGQREMHSCGQPLRTLSKAVQNIRLVVIFLTLLKYPSKKC